MPEHGVLVHYLALTFKHAVEFSSFGCTPRDRLSTSRLGQLDLLYSGCSSESNPTFSSESPLSAFFAAAIPALRQPDLPYQARDRSQDFDLGPYPRPDRAALVPVVVLQSAQDQGSLGVGGFLSGRPLLEFSVPRPAPLEAQRTLRARSTAVKSPPL
jgi:hypothetical protein